MDRERFEFIDAMVANLSEWLADYAERHSEARSDWVVYGLMLYVGTLVGEAPREIKAAVIMEAMHTFAQASGAAVIETGELEATLH